MKEGFLKEVILELGLKAELKKQGKASQAERPACPRLKVRKRC